MGIVLDYKFCSLRNIRTPDINMKRVKQKLKNSRFWRPILQAVTWKEVFLLAVLVGLLSPISDYSLFRIGNFSHLDFLMGDEIDVGHPGRLLNIAVSAIGIISAIKLRRIWWIVAVLPGLVQLVLQYFILDHVLKLGPTGIMMSVLFKLSLAFFIIKGHIRSFSFLAFTILLGIYLRPSQVIMFVVLTAIGRFMYLVISQNLGIFKGVSLMGHLRLIYRTVFRWAAILIFAVPGYLATNWLIQHVIESTYEQTFLNHYHIDKNTKFSELQNLSVKDTLDKYGFDSQNWEITQSNLIKSLIYVEDNIDSLNYSYPEEAIADFHRVFSLLQKGTSKMKYGSNEFVRLYTASFVEHAVVSKMLPGRSEFELDIELSAHDLLREKEARHLKQIDSINNSWQSEINTKIKEVAAKAKALETKANQIALYLDSKIEGNRVAGVRKTAELAREAKTGVDSQLSVVNLAMTRQINTIPAAANEAFDDAVPQTLPEVDSRFDNADHEFYEIKPAAVNMMKGLLRDVYINKRIQADSGVNKKATALAGRLNSKVDSMLMHTQKVLHAAIESYEAKVQSAINSGTYAASGAVYEASVELNKQIIASMHQTQNTLRAVKGMLHNTSDASKRSVSASYRAAKYTISKTLLSLNYGLLFFGFISDAILLLLIVKSFSYVYSRVAFSEKNALSVNIRENPRQHENGVIKRWGSEYTIPVDNQECIFVSRKYTPTGRAPKISIPNWTSAIIARLRSKNYLMNAVEVRENEDETVDFRSMAGAEFVEWDLAEGEEVVFEYNNLVAFSESVRLSTHYSVRITSMMFGKAKFYIAKGPGKLVLLTKGKPITNDSEHLVKSVAVDRIAAWQRSTEFSVDSELSLADVFFSDLYLKRSNDDLIIIDADPGNIKKNIGLAKFIKRFFLPI